MSDLSKVEELIAGMTGAEKMRLLQKIVQDLGAGEAGIETDPNVVGGEARIIRTRIPVWQLVQAGKLGATESDLLRMYPSLRAEDLVTAWAYYRNHREEIEKQIVSNEAA